MAWKVELLLVAAYLCVCAAQTTLLPAGGGTFCPNEEVVFTCSVAGVVLSWEVSLPQSVIPVIRTTYLLNSHTPGDVRTLGPEGELVFNLTSIDPLTSTLTITAKPALNTTEVICSGESFTLLVVAIGPPSPPLNPTSMVAGQTAGTTSATVTVQWGASTGASVSYTVSISPNIPSPVTTSGTSLELQNVPYNIQHTVSVVATNCAGSSSAENTVFTIVGCVVPDSPVGGEWEEFSPSETVGPGTNLSLSCNPGYEPSEVMASTCQPDGSWEPDTAQLECTVAGDCGPPTPASDVVVLEAPVSNTTFNSTFSFRCEEGLFPNTTFEAVCGADDQWSPDPAFHTCGDGNTTDCGVPQAPASGSIAPYSSTLEGAVISFQCGQGFSPSEVVTATCVRDENTGSGTWTPDPAEHSCRNETADCGTPQPPASGSITSQSSTLEGAIISFQCGQGFSPSEEVTAICVRDEDTGSGTWTPDPARHVCTNTSSTSPAGGLSRGAIVGIVIVFIVLAVVCAVVVVVVLVVRRRSGSSKEKNDRPQHEMHLYDDNKSPSHQDSEYNILHHNIPGQSNASNTAVQAVEYSTLGSNGQETPGLTYAEVGHQQQNKNKKSAAMATPKLNSNDDDRVMYSALAAGVTMPTTPEEPPLQPVDKQINLDALLIQLADVSSLWYQLGEVLGVARGTLDDINEACAVSKQFMVEMLDAWLRQQPYPTWKEVASALQVIGAGELGDSIMMVYTTGELPKQVNMTEVPAGSLPNSFHSGPPPPIPPKSTELNSILDSAPPRPPQRSGGGGGGGGGSKRAPPPIPSKGESIDYRAPPPIPRHDPAPPPQLPSRLDPPAPLLPARSDPEAPPRPPKVVPRGGGAGGGGGPPDAPQRPPKPVPRK